MAAMAAHCWAQASCLAPKGRCASSTLRCTDACSSPNLFTHCLWFMLVVNLFSFDPFCFRNSFFFNFPTWRWTPCSSGCSCAVDRVTARSEMQSRKEKGC